MIDSTHRVNELLGRPLGTDEQGRPISGWSGGWHQVPGDYGAFVIAEPTPGDGTLYAIWQHFQHSREHLEPSREYRWDAWRQTAVIDENPGAFDAQNFFRIGG